MKFEFEPIGFVESVYKEKFGIPRQSGLVKSAQAVIRLNASQFKDAMDGLDGFSHVWVLFVFHDNAESKDESGKPKWKPRIRPPRLGGAKKVGVFASRSPHRPNPIGLSAVELTGVTVSGTHVLVHICGADLLDGTPVLDIKPYIRYADSLPRARQGWAQEKPSTLAVSFSKESLVEIRAADPKGTRQLKRLISETVKQDPRPAFQRGQSQSANYAFRLAEFDVHWSTTNGRARILKLISPD
jgi:tRNA-Thr(GGU) m(6)t(6)A37 methyltransferase TsaA